MRIGLELLGILFRLDKFVIGGEMNLNIQWSPAPSGDSRYVRKMQINVSESGVVKPGSYEIETKGNVIYWNLKDNK